MQIWKSIYKCTCNMWAIPQSVYNRGIKGLSLAAVLVLLILDGANSNSRIIKKNIEPATWWKAWSGRVLRHRRSPRNKKLVKWMPVACLWVVLQQTRYPGDPVRGHVLEPRWCLRKLLEPLSASNWYVAISLLLNLRAIPQDQSSLVQPHIRDMLYDNRYLVKLEEHWGGGILKRCSCMCKLGVSPRSKTHKASLVKNSMMQHNETPLCNRQ